SANESRKTTDRKTFKVHSKSICSRGKSHTLTTHDVLPETGIKVMTARRIAVKIKTQVITNHSLF
ncbi:TPA: hypothetical protein ACHJWO_004956, partial [Escherichia coli]